MRRILGLVTLLIALCSISTKAFCQTPSGQGIFIVSSCGVITSPVSGGTWCLTPAPFIGVWNGSSFVSAAVSNVPNGSAGGQLPIWNGSAYVATALSGAATVNSSGVVALTVPAPVITNVSTSTATLSCATTTPNQQAIIAANTTLTVNIPTNGQVCTVDATENGTGNFTIGFAASVGNTLVWNTGNAPTFVTSANTHNVVYFYLNGTTLVGNFGGTGGGSIGSNIRATVNQIIQVTNPPSTIRGFTPVAAVCDGVTDDWSAIQNQIYDDGGGVGSFVSNDNGIAPIQFPVTTHTTPSCFHSKPIEIPYGGLDIGGPSGTGASLAATLSQTYTGPAIIAEGYNSSSIETTTGPFVGSTALVLSTVEDGFSDLYLGPELNGNANNLKGKGGSGFSVGFWFNPTSYTAGGFREPVFSGSVAAPGTGNSTINCALTNTDSTFVCSLNWSGGYTTVTWSGLPPTSTWSYIKINCVSGTCTGSTGGVSKGTASYSGTLNESIYDVYELPSRDNSTYPSGNWNNFPQKGAIYGIKIENASTVSSYPFTPPTVPETADSNTLLLINFDKPADGIVHPWQQAYIGNVSIPNAYIQHNFAAGGSTPPYGIHLHDIALCGESICDGLVTNWAAVSEIDHLRATVDQYGLWSKDSYETNWHDNTINGPQICYYDENAAEADWKNNVCYQGGQGPVFGHIWNSSSGSDIDSKVQDSGFIQWGSIEFDSQLTHIFWFDDAEVSNTNYLGAHYINGDYAQSTFTNDEISAINNGIPYEVFGGAGPAIHGPNIGSTSGSNTPEIIDITSPLTLSASIDGMVFTGATQPPITNIANSVHTYENIFNASVNAVLNPMQPRVLVAGTTGTWLTAGAKCDGTTDDYTALQNTINAALGGIGSFGNHSITPAVEIPTGANCLHSKPLEIGSANLAFGGKTNCNLTGANNCSLSQNYTGPAIILSAYGASVPTTITGPFAGSSSYNITGGELLDFGYAVNSPQHNLTGLTSSSSHVDSWVYVTSYSAVGGSALWGASLTEPATRYSSATQHPSIQISADNTPEMKVEINYGGANSTCTLSGGNLPSINTWHFIRANTVSGTMTCYVDGVSKTTASVSGNVQQNPFESWLSPGNLPQSFPGGSNTNAVVPAYVYGMDIESASAGTPTSVPSAAVSPDVNTILLVNMDKPADGILHSWQQAYSGSSGTPSVYLPWVLGNNSLVPAYSHIHDLNMCKSSNSCDGLFTNWAFNSEFDHLSGTTDYIGIFNYEDYLSHEHDNYLLGNQNTPVCYADWSSSESSWNDNGCWGGALMFHSFAESSGSVIHEFGQDDGVLVYGTASNQGNLDFQFWFDDAEAANTVHIAEHLMSNDYGSSFQNVEDYMRNNSSEFMINGGVGPHVISPATHVVSSTGYIFDIISTPTSPATLVQGHYYDSTPNLTNNLDYVIVLDNSVAGGRGMKTYTFATLPAFVAGTGPFYCKDCTVSGTQCAGSGAGMVAQALPQDNASPNYTCK